MRELPIYVKNQSEMPKEPHWVILKYKTICVPAYEGGTSTEASVEYQAYKTKDAWQAAILELEERYTKEPYTALEVKPASIKRTVTVGIE